MKFALRSLAKSPGFTVVALLTLALGIGVNTSMFSVLNALLLRPLPYPQSERIVRLNRTDPRAQTLPQSPANFLDHERQNQSFTALTAFTLAEPGQPAAQLRGMNVSASFFSVLGVSPLLGRVFTSEEDHPGRNGVVVLSEAFWRERFASDPAAVGQELRLDGQVVTVIGVMPGGFDDRLLWRQPQAWRPLALTDEQRANRGGHYLGVIGRLKPDRSLAQAQAEMSALAATLSAAYPTTNAKSSLHLVSLARSAQDDTTRLLSWFAMGLAGCVLLIACVNLANLQFAALGLLLAAVGIYGVMAGSVVQRTNEIGVRIALGAQVRDIFALVLTQGVGLALLGAALGLVGAFTVARLLGAMLPLLPAPELVTAAGITLTLLAVALFACWLPARRATKVDPMTALRAE